MATAAAQRRWRDKHQFTKRQLNVMVRDLVHKDIDEIAARFGLRGKGEAIGFCSFVAKGLVQYADHDPEARRLLDAFERAYGRDRDLYR